MLPAAFHTRILPQSGVAAINGHPDTIETVSRYVLDNDCPLRARPCEVKGLTTTGMTRPIEISAAAPDVSGSVHGVRGKSAAEGSGNDQQDRRRGQPPLQGGDAAHHGGARS